MTITRRTLLKSTSALALLVSAGLITASQAQAAAGREGFEAKSLADALASLGSVATESKDIIITSPDIAENGAVVPVGVVSNIPNTSEIYIFVEKNPNPLAGVFKIPADTLTQVQSRVKMAQTTNVLIIARADGKLYSATKETKVTLGGCGG
jgi:sulfur-oxidizing protein SoxY